MLPVAVWAYAYRCNLSDMPTACVLVLACRVTRNCGAEPNHKTRTNGRKEVQTKNPKMTMKPEIISSCVPSQLVNNDVTDNLWGFYVLLWTATYQQAHFIISFQLFVLLNVLYRYKCNKFLRMFPKEWKSQKLCSY